mmetsp:Transcript_11962/g.21914  ORF Transcript_11962/g.21914 Transcript_11962/m.21914 type:complete len:219 (-) Transcript_11962:1730-2386(-)
MLKASTPSWLPPEDGMEPFTLSLYNRCWSLQCTDCASYKQAEGELKQARKADRFRCGRQTLHPHVIVCGPCSSHLLELCHPLVALFLSLSSKITRSKLHTIRWWQDNLKGIRLHSLRAIHDCYLRSREVCSCIIDELTLFLGAVVYQASVLGDPHLSQKPIFILHGISLALQLPQFRLEYRLKLSLFIVLHLHAAVLDCDAESHQIVLHLLAKLHCHQ